MEKMKMQMAERTKKGMTEESEEEDFSAVPHFPEGEEVPMVDYEGPKFKEVSFTKHLYKTYEYIRLTNGPHRRR